MNITPYPVETGAAWRACIAWLNSRDQREDPQHVALTMLAEKLEHQRDTLLAALRLVDEQMTGSGDYEHAWGNYPELPERSPASYVREALGNADVDAPMRKESK